ncbi:MAG TPA: aldo/keto reductase [Gemmatimonadaceae bacterium]|jgi:aryl-alcohol dehydrogenase-like predicted oxidoreductase|nr:aldo/keto reductase [Gemmatimonadaceae bacterium]
MRQRRFGRTGWQVGEIGYGMWGMAGWTGSDDDESLAALQESVDLGCNFFDTAWAYGDGHSEHLLGRLINANPGKSLYAATKIPPKNRKWPPRKGSTIAEVFPPEYIREYAEKSLANLNRPHIDLLQFHVWEDAWGEDEGWKRAMDDLKREGLVHAVGLSLNRWEPWNGLATIRTGLIDAVQVIYNIFDQAPEDELFPLCRELDVGVIARVPFDEGSLTGTLTKDTTWPEGDWRNSFFVPANLIPTVERADALKPLVPAGSSMPDMALRFILANPDVGVIIPGMRKPAHVRANVAASDATPLAPSLLAELRKHRWDRKTTEWSQ